MKSKKGMSVVELIVAFVLCILVFVFIMQVVATIEELYLNLGVKTELLNKQSLISEKINEKLNDHSVMLIKKCGSDCYTFIYKDNTFEKMEINKTNNTFSFGNDIYHFNNLGKVTALTMQSNRNAAYNKGILSINLDIKNSIFEGGKYLIKAYYQYDENETAFSETRIDKPEIILFGSASDYELSVTDYKEPGWMVYYPNGTVTINSNDVTASSITVDNAGIFYITYTGTGAASGATARRDIKKLLSAKEKILNLYASQEEFINTVGGTGKYVYRGDNPNNYILVANRLFRILSLDIQNNYKLDSNNNIVTSGGNKVLEDKYLLKVVSNNYLTDTSKNVTIAYGIADDGFTTSAWTSGNNTKYMYRLVNQVYLQELLNTGTGHVQIKNGIFHTGRVDINNFEGLALKDIYDRESLEYEGYSGTWSGCTETKCEPNAAILSLTDVMFASGNSSCTTNASVGACRSNNWVLKDSEIIRLMTRHSVDRTWAVSTSSYVDRAISSEIRNRVTLYLDANLYMIGDGTIDNPYQLYTGN